MHSMLQRAETAVFLHVKIGQNIQVGCAEKYLDFSGTGVLVIKLRKD